MAVAELIGAAIGTMLLVIVAYLLVANQVSADKVIEVTINSAEKETNWQGSVPPKGDAVLVLDVTLKIMTRIILCSQKIISND